MSEVIITTTEYIPGIDIEESYGYISTSFVEGANWLNDVNLALKEVFGGIAKRYTKEIERLKAKAIVALETRVKLLGGNAIIKLDVKVDYISEASYSMFMVNATGTAVRTKGFSNNEESKGNEQELEKIMVQNLLNTVYENQNNEEEFDILDAENYDLEKYLSNKSGKLSLNILDKLLEELKKDIKINQVKLEILKEYFMINAFEEILKKLNSNMTKEKANIIKLFGFIDYRYILKEFKKKQDEKIQLYLIWILDLKPIYIDKENYLAIIELINLLEEKYSDNVEVKKASFSKKNSWICKRCGVAVDMERELCHMCDSGRCGIKLRFDSHEKIISLNKRIDLLKKITRKLEKVYEA